MSSSSPIPAPDVLAAELRLRGIAVPGGPLRVDGYGDSAALSDELIGLIRSGRKRAGTGLLWAMEADGDAMPRTGDVEIVVDHAMRPALVTRLTSVDVRRYDAVDAAYAAIEGEGDGSLDFWQRGHWAFFGRECRRIDREPDPAMPVVCSVFEVLHDLPALGIDGVLRLYAGVWNETDPRIAAHVVPLCLTPDAEIVGPGYRFHGHADVCGEIARFHRDDPGCRVVLTTGFDTHGAWSRFAFALLDPRGRTANEGWDVARHAADGRLEQVVTFWGALPPPPGPAA
ncbi:MAG: ASCH domain-containing protein [Rubrivivax sp.]|nr:ASCH domain-containing protein [Rubrivivax sp.]